MEITAITFEEFVEYGKNNGGNIVNGMPRFFTYKGYPVTHEDDNCYLICLPRYPHSLRFERDDILLTATKGISVVKEAWNFYV